MSANRAFPFLAFCLGMQCAVVEFARNVRTGGVASTEVDPTTSEPVIDMMLEQRKIKAKGGTMRLVPIPAN